MKRTELIKPFVMISINNDTLISVVYKKIFQRFKGWLSHLATGWFHKNNNHLYICVRTMEAKVFFQFEIIINFSVSSSRFIRIPMLWVYGHEKYVYS